MAQQTAIETSRDSDQREPETILDYLIRFRYSVMVSCTYERTRVSEAINSCSDAFYLSRHTSLKKRSWHKRRTTKRSQPRNLKPYSAVSQLTGYDEHPK